MSIKLLSLDDNKIKDYEISDKLIMDMYFLKVRVPKENEIDKKSDIDIDDIKKKISKIKGYIPLYDIFTKNIYVIQKRNIYFRVVDHDYRFPDKLILEDMRDIMENMKKKMIGNKELMEDDIYSRKIRKFDIALKFMENYDLDTLYSNYLELFYRYSPQISNMTFTCRRKSFMNHKSHLKPYYTRDEVIKLALNIEKIKIPKDKLYVDFKDELTKKEYDKLCKIIQKNDISSNILLKHQNYIIENNLVGLIQYYTIQGSYFMNQYLRGFTKYEYKNTYLEENIKTMWNLVKNSPEFDNDYILYRFVSDDSYLSHLEIGDIFIEKGFTSTTRDPFYRNDLYKFGFVLIKIRIPKNRRGVGLCLETLSHFPDEEEIILAPNTELKLISKDENTIYHHPNDEFVSKVKKRYEFEFIKSGEIKFDDRKIYPMETKVVNFLNIPKINAFTVNEKIKRLVNKYFDPMNRIKVKIGDIEYYVKGEYYDSSSVYKPMYSITTKEGFSLYAMHRGYILFMIEIGEEIDNNNVLMKVNYFTKYSLLNREKIMGDDNFLKFIASVGYYFDTNYVVIFSDHMSCDNKSINITNKQRSFSDKKINEEEEDENTTKILGGSYNVDYYQYLKYGKKRYEKTNALNIELKPLFDYSDLDLLKKTKPTKILSKRDRDEIYQIYMKSYKVEENNNTLSNFYIWMIENKCYLMDIFIDKFSRLYGEKNPFINDAYILDNNIYLYNRRLISSYSRFTKLDYDEKRDLLILPKNKYRIDR